MGLVGGVETAWLTWRIVRVYEGNKCKGGGAVQALKGACEDVSAYGSIKAVVLV
jgi:hypothetical protein